MATHIDDALTKYEKASKFDIMQSVKLLQKVNRMSTKITTLSLGEIDDWILLAFSDRATKKTMLSV